MWRPALKPDKTAFQSLASGSFSYTTDYGRKVKIESVALHASVAITETVKVTLLSGKGANYNVVLANYDLVAEQDFVWRPDGEMNLQAEDALRITCTNANLTGIVYLTVKASEYTP